VMQKLKFALSPIMIQFCSEFNIPVFSNELEFLNFLDMKLKCSEFGSYLRSYRGLNWKNTDILFDEQCKKSISMTNIMDVLVFHKFPLILATQERFKIFQDQTTKYLQNNQTLLSIPCGKMRDLLTLTYNGNIELFGIDKDVEAVEAANQFATELNLNASTKVITKLGDALIDGFCKEQPIFSKFNIINSNGLNIYFNDTDALTFYKNLYNALKPNGYLIISHISSQEEWNWSKIDAYYLKLQKIVLSILVQPLWELNLRQSTIVEEHLKRTGFTIKEIIWDTNKMFPTFVAIKGI